MRYNWQQSDWPNFHYDLSEMEEGLLSFIEKNGHISGQISALPENIAKVL